MRNLNAVAVFLSPILVLGVACSKAKDQPSKATDSTPVAAAAANLTADTTPTATPAIILGAGAVDPGVRPSAPAAGQPLAELTDNEMAYFTAGQATFAEIDSVSGDLPVAGGGNGLGPGFNASSCAECHAYPAVGGSSPVVNPQVALANAYGATNAVPFFVTANGPVREARFKYLTNADGSLSATRDGGVHDLFTIAGRYDAGNCQMPQPDFTAAYQANNLSYRIPTPVFGAGLIESISDATILQSFANSGTLREIWGITGHPNSSGNDGTITRFGWKAQNKSLPIFAGEAYNVEQGVTNELFPNERVNNQPACMLNATPEDHTNYDETSVTAAPSDIIMFAAFMRMLAPPTPAAATPSITHGASVFNEVACSLCHTPAMAVTSAAIYAQTANSTANLYSDLMVHHMGATLADDIVQGAAGPDEFRSAPLWGLGQRLYFLHDGRTSDLVQAILQHASAASAHYPASEANLSVQHFLALPAASQQDLVNFLRSL